MISECNSTADGGLHMVTLVTLKKMMKVYMKQ
jgi:hypothetical protein